MRSSPVLLSQGHLDKSMIKQLFVSTFLIFWHDMMVRKNKATVSAFILRDLTYTVPISKCGSSLSQLRVSETGSDRQLMRTEKEPTMACPKYVPAFTYSFIHSL